MRTNTTTRKTEGLGNTENHIAQTPKGVSARYLDLLACMRYDPNGDLPLTGNCLGKSEDGKVYYYCEAVEVTITTPEGKTVGLGKNPYEQFCHSVAKSWSLERPWLPNSALSATEENKSVVSATLIECLENGVSREEIVGKCYTALDDRYEAYKQDTHKTEKRCEHEWKAQRAFDAKLLTADLSTVGGSEADLAKDSPYGGLTLEESERLNRLAELFNAVKEAHKFASPEKWLCALCYALNMPTEVAIERVYGEAIKVRVRERLAEKINYARKKHKVLSERDIEVLHSESEREVRRAVKSAYSKHANEAFGWVLDEVEKRVMAIDELHEALKHCETMLEKAENQKTVNEVHERQVELRRLLCEAEKRCEGYEKWIDVSKRRKATEEARAVLEECKIKYSIREDIIKHLEKQLDALPYSVLRYCEAVKAGAIA